MPSPPCRSEKVERDELSCGVNSKDPNRIEFPELGDEEALEIPLSGVENRINLTPEMNIVVLAAVEGTPRQCPPFGA